MTTGSMFELSACVEWLFAEEPRIEERIRRAAAAGFPSVEFWTWREKDLAAIGQALTDTGVVLEAFVSEPTGRLVDSRTHDEFAAGIVESARVAILLGCSNLIVLAGDTVDGLSDERQRENLVRSLRQTAPLAGEFGIALLLEPLNTRLDHVGHYLHSTDQGLSIVEEVAEDNVRLLLDLYHAAIMNEQLDEMVGDRMALVGHVHVADAPGRHEPGTGEIDWRTTLGWLHQRGYRGRLGLEYQPTGDTSSSLSFVRGVVAT